MPQPKRRKLSLDEQDGKDREKNRITQGTDEVEKQNAAALPKDGSGSNGLQATQPDRKASQSKTERKADGASSSLPPSSSLDDGKDGATTSSMVVDGSERVSSSGRVIRPTNKQRCFTAAREAAQHKQSGSTVQAVVSAGQPAQKVGKSSTPLRPKKGKRRSWDLWSKFEQDAFFEGLFEHGKDFDAIHNLLLNRSKKRGIEPALIKTKDQVRQLYYRMWQKIAKHVDMGNNVKKEAQEIYGLVNYYAIRKVFKRMDDRAKEVLNELIMKGISKVREPNQTKRSLRKKLRVLRTPVCNALKKLNNIEDAKEEFVADMPQQVTVELTPRSSAAWLRVHSLSQNPRVRFQVSVNRSLSSLMEYLQRKWKGPTDRLRSSLGESEAVDDLMVFPHHSYTLKPVTLAAQWATSVDDITFTSYKNNVLINSPPAGGSRSAKKGGDDPNKGGDNLSDGDEGALAGADHPKRSRSAKKGGCGGGDDGTVRVTGDNLSDGEVPAADGCKSGVGGDSALNRPVRSSVKINLLSKLSDSVSGSGSVQGPQPHCEDENAMFPDTFSPPPSTSSNNPQPSASKEEPGLDVQGENSSLATNSTCDSEDQKGMDGPSPETSPQTKEKIIIRDSRGGEERISLVGQNMKELVQSAMKGFSVDSGKMVTLAKLSLMLGKAAHIRLEYEWRLKSWSGVGAGSGGGAGYSVPPQGVAGDVERMTNMLRRLSSLASVEYRERLQSSKMVPGGKMSQCTLCGHLLDRVYRRKTTSDVATETEPLEGSVAAAPAPPEPNLNPPSLSDNDSGGVMTSSNSAFLTHLKMPDDDGVFRVPMPISVQPVRAAGAQRTSSQTTASQPEKPEDSVDSKLSALAPYKRRPKRKPVVFQRSLLPRMPNASQLIVLQSMPGAVTPVQPGGITPMQAGTVTPIHSMPGTVAAVQPGAGTLVQSLPGAVTPLQSHIMLQSVAQSSPLQAEVAMGDGAISSSSEIPQLPAMTLMNTGSLSGVTRTVSSTVTSMTSSVVMTTPSHQGGASQGSMAGLFLGDNSVSSSELFSQLDMGLLVSPNPSPSKSSQRLVASSVSPPSLSSMLDISLAPLSNQGTDAGDRFLEMVTNGNTGFSGLLRSPVKVGLGEEEGVGMGDGVGVRGTPVVSESGLIPPSSTSSPPSLGLQTPTHASMHTPKHTPASPSHKPPTDTQWLSAEVPELSLSEFEDSPVKKSALSAGNGLELGIALPQLTLSQYMTSPVKRSQTVGGVGEGSVDPNSLSLSHFLQSPVKKESAHHVDFSVGENSVNASDIALSRFMRSPVKKNDQGLDGGSGVPATTGAVSTSSVSGVPLSSGSNFNVAPPSLPSGSNFIPAPPSLFGESSQDSLVARLDMDTALQSVMLESSIDYSTKFEGLAEHLADNTSQTNM